MGHLARMAQRVFGVEDAIRPAMDRWHVARPSAIDGASVAAFSLGERVAAAQTETPHSTGARAGLRERAHARGTVAARASTAAESSMAEDATRTAAKLVARSDIRSRAEPPPAPGALGPAPTLEVRSVPRERETRLLPAQPVAPIQSARRGAATFETARKTLAPAEPGPVYVHIGRIDVRAADAPATKTQPVSRSAMRKPSLEAHLRARDRGAG